jgi:hypothetical protein
MNIKALSITTAICCALALILTIILSVKVNDSNAYAHHQQTTISQLKQELSFQEQVQASTQSALTNLENPSNPLSAYTDVCSINNTNSSTGVDQLYYYPCTNNVIPTTGN